MMMIDLRTLSSSRVSKYKLTTMCQPDCRLVVVVNNFGFHFPSRVLAFTLLESFLFCTLRHLVCGDNCKFHRHLDANLGVNITQIWVMLVERVAFDS